MGRKTFAILNLSATGMLYAVPDFSALPAKDSSIVGQIRFQDGQTLEVSGWVLRRDSKKGTVVVTFDQEIDGSVMMEQHRIWIQKGYRN